VPPQIPDWHVSPDVQELPSLHEVPFATGTNEQMPLLGSQMSVLHWFPGEQTTGFEPVQTPDWQLSVWVQAFPSLHAVPFATAGLEQTPVDVLQVPTV
jgi:hypothetical protein